MAIEKYPLLDILPSEAEFDQPFTCGSRFDGCSLGRRLIPRWQVDQVSNFLGRGVDIAAIFSEEFFDKLGELIGIERYMKLIIKL